MAINHPAPQPVREYTVQLRGEVTVKELREALRNVDDDTELHSIQLSFAVDEQAPVTLFPQRLEGEVKTLEPAEEPGDDTATDTTEDTTEDAEAESGQGDMITASDLPESPSLAYIDFDQISQYEYQALQRVASNEGIRGNMKRDEMVEALKEKAEDADTTSDEEEALTAPDDPEPEDLEIDRLDDYEYQTLQKAASNAGIKGNQKAEELKEELRAHVGEPTRQQSLPLRPGHDPFYVMRSLQDTDGWALTEEVRDDIPDDWDVNRDTIGNTLWHLEDRGLVEKRAYEDDKRKKEYRLTSEGEEVIEQAVEFAEEEGLVEPAAA